VEILLKVLAVLGLGAVELWTAIPAGLALDLHPLLIGIVSAAGAILGVIVILVLGEGVRSWLLRRRGGGEKRQHGRIYRIWIRYGVAGLGLLAPLLTGAPLGTALGMALGAPAGRLLLWMSLGIVAWSALLTTAGALGLAGIESLTH
jgi:hypothetical protein